MKLSNHYKWTALGAITLTLFSVLIFLLIKSYTYDTCLLYTSPSPRDATLSRMPSSA